MNLASSFRRKERIAARRIAGESFLVPVCGRPLDMENIFVLSPLADFIWQRLDGDHTVDRIIADVVESYEVEREQAGTDVIDFVTQLLQNDLVEEVA
jgi:hypothetical protein